MDNMNDQQQPRDDFKCPACGGSLVQWETECPKCGFMIVKLVDHMDYEERTEFGKPDYRST